MTYTAYTTVGYHELLSMVDLVKHNAHFNYDDDGAELIFWYKF